jgi:hypothetical protein
VLKFFRKNHVLNSLLLLPYALALRFVALVFAEARVPGVLQGAWGEQAIAAAQGLGVWDIVLAALLVFFQASLINRISIRHSLMGEINLLPGLAYVLLTSLHPAFLGLSSLLVANTPLLIAFMYLFDVIKKEHTEENKFMLGFWIGITGLLYTPYLLLGLFGLVAMSVLKTIKVKEVFQYLTGFATPFLIGWLVRVIESGALVFYDTELFAFFGMPELATLNIRTDLIPLGLFGLLLLFSLLGYSQLLARKNIHAQKKLDTVYTFMLFCAPMILFLQVLSIGFALVLALALSLFLAIMLRQVKLPAIAESVHFILVVLAWLAQALVTL